VKLADSRLQQCVLEANARAPGEPVCRSLHQLAQNREATKGKDAEHKNSLALGRQLVEHHLDDQGLERIERCHSEGERHDDGDGVLLRQRKPHCLIQSPRFVARQDRRKPTSTRMTVRAFISRRWAGRSRRKPSRNSSYPAGGHD
jgi:hypothetical protein